MLRVMCEKHLAKVEAFARSIGASARLERALASVDHEAMVTEVWQGARPLSFAYVVLQRAEHVRQDVLEKLPPAMKSGGLVFAYDGAIRFHPETPTASQAWPDDRGAVGEGPTWSVES